MFLALTTIHKNNDSDNSTIFVRGKSRGRYRGNYRGSSRGNRGNKSQINHTDGSKNSDSQSECSDGKNPLNEDGTHTQCVICKSIYHWAPKCPHKDSSKGEFVNESISSENSTLLSEKLFYMHTIMQIIQIP